MSQSRLVHAAAVVFGFTLLFVWIFWRPIASGQLLAESDLFYQYLPLFISTDLIWSPYEFGGVPAFADPESSAFYPLRWVFARLIRSWNGFLISAFVLAAGFTYAYVLRQTGSRRAATVGAAAFVLSEAVLDRLPHANILHAIAWLPLLLLSIDEIRGRSNWALWVSITGFAGANVILAGHPQMSLYIAYLCGAYAFTGLVVERAPMHDWYRTVAGGIAAPVLAAVSVLPLTELAGRTLRQSFGFAEYVEYANSPRQMLSALFPVITHSGLEAPTYVGLFPLLLALIAISRWRGQWRVLFWVTVIVVTSLLGAGDSTPLAQLMYHLPFYDRFRIVARHLVFAALGVSILSGYAVAALEQRAVSRRAVTTAIVLFATALVAGAMILAVTPGDLRFDHVNELFPLPWLVDRVWIQLFFAVVAIVALLAVWTNPTSRWAWATVVAFVVCDLLFGSASVVTATGLQVVTVVPEATKPGAQARALAERLGTSGQRFVTLTGALRDDVVPGLFSRPWKMANAGGYTSVLLDNTANLASISPNGRVAPAAVDVTDVGLDVLAVKYALVRRDIVEESQLRALQDSDRWRLVESFRQPEAMSSGASRTDDHEYGLYENMRAMPRAWLATEVLPVTDGQLADAMHGRRLRDSRTFNPRRTALVDEGDLRAERFEGDGSVHVRSIEDSRVLTDVDSPAGGFLILSESYYPGWQARIDDGALQPVHRTDMALQGITVPAGRHTVSFEFVSASRRTGIVISVCGAVALFGAILLAARQPR